MFFVKRLLSSTISSSTSSISDELKLSFSIILFLISGIAMVYVYFKMKKIKGALAFMEVTNYL